MEVQVCLALSLVTVLTVVEAQVPHWGPCPEPSTQPAFNLKRFMGRWFEVAKLPAQFEKGRCIETNFTLTTDMSARVQSSEILVARLVSARNRRASCLRAARIARRASRCLCCARAACLRAWLRARAYLLRCTRVRVRHCVCVYVCVCVCVCVCAAVLPYTPYWILYTDYVCSAVVYSCTDVLRIFHVDFAWILGRSRTLSESTVQHAKEIFMENRIDVSRMIASSQEDCYRAA
ncbi:apolipoprotein Da, duplicate 1 [Hemibagrus wyckioides]|uniref:apolipoprotein Da, duplicate 1 n=1 Tax=Hemibagrus wyckioides TaxID=337641 RepID=UPI00266CF58F|nr:apolipoprotein Da, duplicate 1 [Hemibagrus wyckioides]